MINPYQIILRIFFHIILFMTFMYFIVITLYNAYFSIHTFHFSDYSSIYSQTSIVRHPDKMPLRLVRQFSRILVFKIRFFIYVTPLNASPCFLPLCLRRHFKTAIYNRQQNYLSTCDNTCKFFLVLLPILIISCLL